MTAEPLHFVFVYGTLKRGGSNHALMLGQKFLGETRTKAGFVLVQLGAYPGMIRDGTDTTGVSGEVWAVDERTIAQLDDLEGLDEGLYRRELISLPPPFAEKKIETYVYARDVADKPRIKDGYWPC